MRNRRASPVGQMGAWREFLVPLAIATNSRGGARILQDARFGGASRMDTLRIGVARGDYPDALGREEAWPAARAAKLATATGERHEQQVADGRWLMIEERRTSDGGVIGLRVDITELKRQAAALEQALARAEAAQRA